MDKAWYMSKTVWGGFLLAVEAALITLDIADPNFKAVVAFFATFLTVYGFRDAMKK